MWDSYCHIYHSHLGQCQNKLKHRILRTMWSLMRMIVVLVVVCAPGSGAMVAPMGAMAQPWLATPSSSLSSVDTFPVPYTMNADGIPRGEERHGDSSVTLPQVRYDDDAGEPPPRPPERRMRERIIADAVANAVADVIRARGEAAVADSNTNSNNGFSSPSSSSSSGTAKSTASSATPVNTKEFAYTNIRFKSFVNEDTSAQDDSFLQSLQETAMNNNNDRDTNAASASSSGSSTQPAPVPKTDTNKNADLEAMLDAKLASIQKEMSELEELKKQLEATKNLASDEEHQQQDTTNKRRLLLSQNILSNNNNNKKTTLQRPKKYEDSGVPGWDAFKLINKKSAMLQDNMDTLQKNIGEKNARLNRQLVDLLAFGAEKIGDVAGYQGDKQVVRSDMLRTFFDAVQDAKLNKIGKFQSFLEAVMDRTEATKTKILDHIM